MKNLSWKIGEVEIFQIVELEAGQIIQGIMPDATPENIRAISWLTPYFADEKGNIKAVVQSFLIKSGGKNILIDTCNGNDKVRTDVPEWGKLQTNFLDQLHSLGATEKDVNMVACTHLHFDHIGWNTKLENGAWVPTFPNARYLFAEEEYKYWEGKPEKEIAADKASFDDSIAPIVRAGLVKLVNSEYKIDRNISFISTPGHTPHHVSVLIESEGKRAIISGDFLHHPCQIAHPEWTAVDTFPNQALETRQKTLEEIVDTDTLLIGTHFANPVAGKVVRLNGSFVFKI